LIVGWFVIRSCWFVLDSCWFVPNICLPFIVFNVKESLPYARSIAWSLFFRVTMPRICFWTIWLVFNFKLVSSIVFRLKLLCCFDYESMCLSIASIYLIKRLLWILLSERRNLSAHLIFLKFLFRKRVLKLDFKLV